jgi:hypothetical protein
LRHLNQIFDKLNLTKEKGLYLAGEDRGQLFSNRVERLINKVIKPDAFFCIDNKPFILFFENLGTQKKSKLKEIWNFNETPIVIVSEQDSVEIYNGFEYLTNKGTLKLFGNEDKLNDFKYFEIVTGKTWEKYQSDFDSKHRIDFHLLSNIKSARDILISQSLSSEHANSLIGKIIFVRYIIDRKIKLDFEKKGKSRIWTNSEFCSILSDKNQVQKFFKYLKDKFNGDLFPLSKTDIESIPSECLTTLIELLSGDNVGTAQKSLFNLYDFSIIPVEFISNVYELFIGVDEQEKQGAYYTPLFLVDYILAETVEKKFTNYKGYDCKVLDPACGSGIFLVETLRKIIEKYQAKNPNYKTNIDQYKEDLKKLASDNIFGVDKDKSAINVAVFSIYLTLLDYQNPSDIENFKFPHLENRNFFVSDFFDTESDFNKVLRKKEFSFILGNPPWKRGKGEEKKPLYVKYIENRQKTEKGLYNNEIKISNKEIAQAFVLRTSDFASTNTNIGLIVTSKILYNQNAKDFRKYFLECFTLKKVFELSPVRREVFNNSNDKAIAPASVLFYNYTSNNNNNENIVEHITLKPSRFFSLFKVFTIQRADYKKVSQKQLKEYDYLWKVLVYGTYLDFNLINRLKNAENYKSIEDVINNDEDFLVGQGAMIGGGDKNDSSHLKGRNFLDTRKDIKSFWINYNTNNVWDYDFTHRPRNEELYKAPMVLITEGINTNFRSVSAVCRKDIVFRSSLTAIKSLSNQIDILESISGILNSSFFSYFCLQTFSSSGIEREQSHDIEKFTTPFINDKSIVSIVKVLTTLKNRQHSLDTILKPDFSLEIESNIKQLDKAVISAFSFSQQDKDLLDYATDVSIPSIMKHKGSENNLNPIDIDSETLSSYIELFLNSFNEIYKRIDQQLIVEIKYTRQLIGLFFKLAPIKSDVNNKSQSIQENTTILELLSVLGVEKITDKLFIQKDVRGFENDGFYIVKPNEKRLWHKAIAHLDVNEFRDAILIAGKHTTINV